MNEELNRVKTGITGLDELIDGGFPKGSTIVVTGTPGSGKTIAGMNFIAEGCRNGEKCLFVTVEQLPERIFNQARQFNMDFTSWEQEGRLKITTIDLQKLFEMKNLDEIKQLMEADHYDRMVIDSLTSMARSPIPLYSIADGADRGLQPSALTEMNRYVIMSFIDLLQAHGITSLLISQKVEGLPGDTVDNISEFKADALIVLESKVIGKNAMRTIQVKKMRETNINITPLNIEFSENGITIV